MFFEVWFGMMEEVSSLPTFLFSFGDFLLDVFFEIAPGIVSVMSADFGKHIRFGVDEHAVGSFSAPGGEAKSILAEVGDQLSDLPRNECILSQRDNCITIFPRKNCKKLLYTSCEEAFLRAAPSCYATASNHPPDKTPDSSCSFFVT